jgi:hypothetical protein
MSSERWLEQGSLFDLTPSGSGTSVWLPTQGELSHGESWTADTSEWPSGDDGFLRVSLSEILLRIGPDEPYWLSAKACAGILRRASPEGEGVAGGVAAGVGDKSSTGVVETLVDFGRTSDRIRIDADTAATLQAGGGGAGAKTGLYMVPQAALTESAYGEWRESDEASFLRVGGSPSTLTIRKVRSSEWVEDQTGSTLAARDYKDSGDLVVEPQDFSAEWSAEETGTIQARGYKGLNHENVRDGQAVVQTYGVRRLTPVECERLQSFPDGWTEPAGSDSARYKAMGNAVTVNVVRWILGRLP